jgi:hypothetical protein
MNFICPREGCENEVVQTDNRRPRKFCSSYCKHKHWVEEHPDRDTTRVKRQQIVRGEDESMIDFLIRKNKKQ